MAAVEIPGGRLEPIAREVARNSKFQAILGGLLCIAFGAVWGTLMVRAFRNANLTADGVIIGVIFDLLLALIAITSWRTAQRARVVVELTKRNDGTRFELDDRLVQVRDATGNLRKDLSFGLRYIQKLKLLELPEASIHRRDE